MVFAKDKKQAVLAVFVLVLFLFTTIRTSVIMYKEQHPETLVADSAPMSPEDPTLTNQAASENLTSPDQSAAVDGQSLAQDANDIYSQTLNIKGNPSQSSPTTQINVNLPAAEPLSDAIEIMPKHKSKGKRVTIAVDESGRTNPFLPSAENVPKNALAFLTAPPETLPADTDASKIITTTISGILYDKYSPSAIINIEGIDYLVKKGDVINHYKILSIGKTQVIVQLGRNIYQAGVGELLSQTDLNQNTIANLNKKFGGNEVSINIRKKGY